MSDSVFWARVLGFYAVILSIGNVFDREHLQSITMALIGNPTNLMLAGVFTLLLGLAIVVRHNLWQGWPILITILGFWITFKGLMLLFFPSWINEITTFWHASNVFVTAIPTFILGLILLYCGYIHKGSSMSR